MSSTNGNSTSINLPEYNTARGGADSTLQIKPPFDFYGVTARVFPLKANMYRLREFCDSYLNIMPQTIAKFQPALPFVFLAVLDYGKMSVEKENLGWAAQNEVTFTVPLEWYCEENGQLVFQDWAFVSPFIFVNNEMSLRGGRDVYGWPKVRGWLDPEVNPWVSNPRNPRHLLTLSTMVFHEVYAGEMLQPEVLLEINHEPPPTFSQFPPDLTNPFNPLLSIPQAILNSLSVMGDVLSVLSGLPIMGYNRVFNLPSLRNMVVKGFETLNMFSSDLYSNEITLKQFRDAEYPNQVCYQALIKSKMGIRRYNDGGLLGDINLLWGDSTGGFKIKLHRYPNQPIVESLGLEFTEEEGEEESSVAILQPLFPFWFDADLHYGLGYPLCWRTRVSDWHIPATSESPEPEVHREMPKVPQERDDHTGAGHPYNTTRGAAIQQITGPFYSPNVTMHIIALKANKKPLEEFCQKYLENDFYSFELGGPPYVYLIVRDYKTLPETNVIGWWPERDLQFCVPVNWYLKDGKEKLPTWVVVVPFVFQSSSIGAIITRDVLGLPAVYASIESPEGTWISEPGAAKKRLLTLKTRVFPVLDLGQRAEERVLLEICGKELTSSSSEIPELVKPITSVQNITLKQFRDATHPDHVCYQAIVQHKGLNYFCEQSGGIEEVDVGIHRYPGQPLVKVLGLEVARTERGKDVPVDHLQPIGSFWANAASTLDLGHTLCWRAGTKQWQRGWIPDPSYFKGNER